MCGDRVSLVLVHVSHRVGVVYEDMNGPHERVPKVVQQACVDLAHKTTSTTNDGGEVRGSDQLSHDKTFTGRVGPLWANDQGPRPPL